MVTLTNFNEIENYEIKNYGLSLVSILNSNNTEVLKQRIVEFPSEKSTGGFITGSCRCVKNNAFSVNDKGEKKTDESRSSISFTEHELSTILIAVINRVKSIEKEIIADLTTQTQREQMNHAIQKNLEIIHHIAEIIHQDVLFNLAKYE